VKELRDNPGIFETTKVSEDISHGILHGILPVIRGTGGTTCALAVSRKSVCVYIYVIFVTNKHILTCQSITSWEGIYGNLW
jgi:hypothetical protein